MDLSGLSRALREDERQAWKLLVRVLSHEINNSLAPIKSISGTLRQLARQLGAEEPLCSRFRKAEEERYRVASWLARM